MKKLALLISLTCVALAVYATPCEFSHVKFTNVIRNTTACTLTFDFSFEFDMNGGNKYLNINIWNTSNYPTVNYGSSPTSIAITGGSGALCGSAVPLFSASIDMFNITNLASPITGAQLAGRLYDSYIDNTCTLNWYDEDSPTGRNLTSIGYTQVGSSTVYVFTIAGITIDYPCTGGVGLSGDVWASQAAGSSPTLHCSSANVISLPTLFGAMSATVKGDQLHVIWQTLTEKDCKEYVVEASKDGSSWKSIGKLESKASNGNSSSPIAYEFVTSVSLAFAGLSLAFLLLSTFFKSRVLKALMLLAVVGFAVSCMKDNSSLAGTSKDDSKYVRIVQHGTDGSVNYSKVVVIGKGD